MTRILGTLVLLAAILAVIGFSRGWFYAETTTGDQQSTVNVTIDKDKIRQDENTAQEKAQQLKQDLGAGNQTPATQLTPP
jgi:hypothetical protein